MNDRSRSHDDFDSDLPRWLQTRIITMADHTGIPGRTKQDHPLHFDAEREGIAV